MKFRKKINKFFVVFSACTLLINILAVGAFFVPQEVQAGVGTIAISQVVELGAGDFKIYGTWEPVGGQPCWNSGKGFRYKIVVTDNDVPVEPNPMVMPAACNGDFDDSDGVANADNKKGGEWPAAGQAEAIFALEPGTHTICALLVHVSDQGGDVVQTQDCWEEEIVVPEPEAGAISGYKYEDLDKNISTEGDWTGLENWAIQLFDSATATEPIAETLTDIYGSYLFENLLPGGYWLKEVFPTGEAWMQLSSPTVPVIVESQATTTDQNFVNYLPMCGNNVLDEGEQCDDGNLDNEDGCSSICELEVPVYQCSDGIDNDDDGLIDELDPGCWDEFQEYNPNDNDETNTLPQCFDFFDNDGDTYVDAADPGCHSDGDAGNSSSYEPEDNDEIDMTPRPIEPGEVVINELMWMGTDKSNADEWIELFNTTDREIDLSDCYLTRFDGSAEVVMFMTTDFSGQSIASQSYFLISNYNESSSNISIDPDLVDTSVSLSNSDLQIKLYCGADVLIDTAGDAGDPVAGDNGDPKKSMQRVAGALDGTLVGSWCTASSSVNWDEGTTELGTPGAVNDCGQPETGSLKICKYEDEDGDLETVNDQNPLAGWVFDIGENGHLQTATTTEGGCVTVSGLEPGSYIIDERIPDNWTYLWPGNNTSTEVIIGEISEVNFYNFQLGKISGYKYEDIDGQSSTKDDWQILPDWLIYLYDVAEQTIPLASTTTDILGVFEFSGLEAGDYILGEELPVGWEQFRHPTTTITILSGTESNSDKNDFVNYYAGSGGEESYCGDGIWQSPNSTGTGGPLDDGYEECDGNDGISEGYHCTALCVLEVDTPPSPPSGGGGGGGSGPTRYPDVNLSLEYPTQKELEKNYIETLVVSNTGNIVLTNGMLTVDLPEDKLTRVGIDGTWYAYDLDLEQFSWQIPTLMVGENKIFTFEVAGLDLGEAITTVNLKFDQIEENSVMTETIIEASAVVAGEGETVPEPEEGGTVAAEGTGVGEAGVTGTGEEQAVAGEETGEEEVVGTELLPEEVKGVTTKAVCTTCGTWEWILIAVLMIILNLGYYLTLPSQIPAKEGVNKAQTKKGLWWGWLIACVAAVAAAVVFIVWCLVHHSWLMLILLAGYLGLLVINSLNIKEIKGLNWKFSLLLAILPVLVIVFVGGWAWWLWLLVIALYLAVLIGYFIGVLDEKFAKPQIPLVLFILVLLYLTVMC